MEGDGLRAEGEFFVLFGLCQEQLKNRVLETALFSLFSARENHEEGEVFPVVSELGYLLLEHVVTSDDLDFCLWDMSRQGGLLVVLIFD